MSTQEKNRDKEPEVAEEQKQLAELIKIIHCNLRKETEIYGASEAWQRHVAKADVLESYASSMKKLATEYWKKASEDRRNVHCRIDWIKNQCCQYFLNGGKEKFDQRETEILNKLDNQISSNPESKDSLNTNLNKIKLLDVGSCYDPFRGDDTLDVTAIDLAPSCPTVLQCDFLTVKVEKLLCKEDNKLTQLPCSHFDAVIFSLFLEYLPCPRQRYLCCNKAYQLLKSGGLLVIITPDSKHVNANAKFMKSWRFVLSKLGMMRVRYEKLPHMHCLVYRKCIHAQVARRWPTLQQTITLDDKLFTYEDKIFIPQDFQDHSKVENKGVLLTANSGEGNATAFNQLPFNDTEEIPLAVV